METTNLGQRRDCFPERLALVNDMCDPAKAFEMRYAKEIRICNGAAEKVAWNHYADFGKCVVKHGESLDLLRYTTETQVCDAVLLVSPYVRFLEGDGLGGRLVFLLDDDIVVDESVEKYLVSNMESPALDVPMKKPPKVAQFYAAYLTKEKADPNKAVYGIMAPNGSLLTLSIKDAVVPKGGSVRVDVGFIAALYTTKL